MPGAILDGMVSVMVELFPLRKYTLKFNPQYHRMWPYLEIGLLQM